MTSMVPLRTLQAIEEDEEEITASESLSSELQMFSHNSGWQQLEKLKFRCHLDGFHEKRTKDRRVFACRTRLRHMAGPARCFIRSNLHWHTDSVTDIFIHWGG